MSTAAPFAPVASELSRVEARLLGSLAGDGAAGASIAPLMGAGGKRVRPALALLAGRCGSSYTFERVAPGALAVELTHLATLVHDDVIDHSVTRRGVPTVSAAQGDGTAIVVGDFYFSRAYAELCRTGDSELVDALAETVMQMCAGELQQQAARYHYTLGRDEYMQRIERKTARLLQLCCVIGSRLGGADAETDDALRSFGLQLGLAFQIADDVLDYIGESRNTRKPVGQDLLEGHATLPLLIALETPGIGPDLASRLPDGSAPSPEVVRAVTEAVRGCGAVETALQEAQALADGAVRMLARLPRSEERDALAHLASFAVHRDG